VEITTGVIGQINSLPAISADRTFTSAPMTGIFTPLALLRERAPRTDCIAAAELLNRHSGISLSDFQLLRSRIFL